MDQTLVTRRFRDPADAGAAARAAGHRKGRGPSRRTTVLVVEDHRQVRELICSTLARHDFAVLSADCPSRALEIAATREQQIDLLLADLVLPEMSGRDLAEHLRGERRDLAVLYVSGYPTSTLERYASSIPDGAFLAKPFRPSDLISKVHERLV